MKMITPGVLKLVKHKNICDGDLKPISAQIDLTSYCNLRCTFCSSKNERSRKKKHR
jgi:MoaA/NifB/PqqE/SkfB family radical SAM enzyme